LDKHAETYAQDIDLHYIWFRGLSFWPYDQMDYLRRLADNIGDTDYLHINDLYLDLSPGDHVNVTHDAARDFDYSTASIPFGNPVSSIVGKFSLTHSDVRELVAYAAQQLINQGLATADSTYILLSDQVTEESDDHLKRFCTDYCAWHTTDQVTSGSQTLNLRYAFVGKPSSSCGICEHNTVALPRVYSGEDVDVDAMASTIVHELSGFISDPAASGWYSDENDGPMENADLCAWKFGTPSNVNGADYNFTLGGEKYLLQQIYSLSDRDTGEGECALGQVAVTSGGSSGAGGAGTAVCTCSVVGGPTSAGSPLAFTLAAGLLWASTRRRGRRDPRRG